MASNMTPEEVHLHLREVYNGLFGGGYALLQPWDPAGHPGQSLEALYTYIWFFGTEGPASVYIDIMANHGGDDALRARPGFGAWR